MRIILLVFLILTNSAIADPVENQLELALLPPYCRGTQLIRNLSGDPTPIDDYVSRYGKTYIHLHHYCWALNSENKASHMTDKALRESKLGYALGDIKYVLDRAEPKFVLLPDIYNTQARILFALRHDTEAIVSLNKAIEANPEYVPAYLRLSDYFVEKGNKNSAIKILEEGIDNTENATTLIKRLAKLGKTYSGVPGNKRKTSDATSEAAPTQAKKQNENSNENSAAPTIAPASSTVPTLPGQTPEQAAKGRYCRFCP